MTVAGAPKRAASVPSAVGQGGRRARTSSQATPLLLSKKAKSLLNAHGAASKSLDACEPSQLPRGRVQSCDASATPQRKVSAPAQSLPSQTKVSSPSNRRKIVSIAEDDNYNSVDGGEVASRPKRAMSTPPARISRTGSMDEDPSKIRRVKTATSLASDKPTGPESFEIQSILGKGSFGAVYKVEDKRTGDVFAMKILQKDHVFAKNLVRYTLTEKNVMAKSNHPFIVGLHHAFQTPSTLVLIQQFCPNGSIEGLLKKETMIPEDVAQLYTAEIFLAIEHLHAKKIIYRDMKSANVVLDEGNHAMLTDFGLSKQGVEGLKGTRSFCGSCAYIAPEVLSREGHGSPVDIYGLGVLLFEMITGKPPYIADNKDQLFKNIKGAELSIPTSASKNCADFLGSVMQRDPAQRLGARHTPDLRSAPFLSVLDLEKVLHRQIPVPPLKRDQKPASWIGAVIRRTTSTNSTVPSLPEEQENASGSAANKSTEMTPQSPKSPFLKSDSRPTWRTPQRRIQGWDYSDDPGQQETRRCRLSCLWNIFRRR